MSNVHLASTIPASFVPPKAKTDQAKIDQADRNQFVPIALFSGIGLLVSLVAILYGVQGAWY